MSEPTVAKIVLAVAGLALFLTGVRADIGVLRWTGIGLVSAAWLMRFVWRRRAKDDQDPSVMR